MIYKFSIIIPTYLNEDSIFEILPILIQQKNYINEIIIIDSSKDDKIKRLIENFNNTLIKYNKVDKSFPGKARNIGVNKATGEWIAFLDSKTIPNINWLEFLSGEIKYGYDVIFGSVKFDGESDFQKIVKAASYGNLSHICVPGTAIKKEVFLENYFLENVLAGEDIIWKKQLIKNNYKIKIPDKNTVIYNKLPNSLNLLLKKYLVYSYHASKLNIFPYIKISYLIIFLLFFYINLPKNFFLSPLNISIKSFLFTSVISLIIIFLMSITARGIILPLYRSELKHTLFPFNWLKIGFVGFLLDLVKAPSYLLGSIFLFFNFNAKNDKKISLYTKKILFVCPYPFDQQAGQRLKYEQHLNFFKENGYDYEIKPFMNNNFYQIVYIKNFYFKKIIYTITGYLNRIKLIFSLYKYDYVYIFLWVTPFGGFLFEFIYRLLSKKIIYDVEDNIFINVPNEINLYINYLKFKSKYLYLIKKSDFIITSSPKLKNICDLNNNNMKNDKSLFIPPSINLQKYWPLKETNASEILTIGWTGTFSSQEYLTSLTSVFNKLSKLINFQLLIISNNEFTFDNINTKFIRWNKENEINDLLKIDIGLYPLKIDPWVEGKSGLKAMQYMSLGIPTIATNVGQAINIIDNEYDGFLVNTEQEWIDSIIKLHRNPNLRKIFGIRSRKKIEKMFSFDSIKNKYLNILKEL